ncbi:hypothetical protein EZV77_24715 [Burkholderia thailandensis]|nr:hypothetical protein A8H32_10610 [Burkholderia thailandensis]PJO74075.1 hypothetical protein CWD92_01845 [Burkholderia thailandensis]TBW57000.1 hypothetical protein EZV77_24715 [Burkholderia thailandensis]TGB33235.1 hypothetical protein C6946_13465 [Burkholderia thailandensis]
MGAGGGRLRRIGRIGRAVRRASFGRGDATRRDASRHRPAARRFASGPALFPQHLAQPSCAVASRSA